MTKLKSLSFGSNSGYKALPTDVRVESPTPCNNRSKRSFPLRILTITSLMVMVLFGARHVVRSGLPKCMGGGTHRTMTSLPSHYTLPSGDKIPSVALGVWRAAPNEVGEAVKTSSNGLGGGQQFWR
ncbi:hypothetical protein K438DRAFT_1993872 [Mycena galopus ATCC 62051]|nr:hypothetical protein K438DRAFT_1993872 [Mycena galopus ATCC 62051]